MNKVYLNTVSLAKEPVINKGASAGGSGSGVTIKNQEKSLEITENGTTEVTADAGFTGLSKVVVNTNVQSGGGGGSDMPVIGDGKTYLYIKIAAEGRMDVPLRFQQSVENGVTIDWGDGSAPQTLSGTGNRNTTHKYAAIGDYVISLDPADGCTLGLGSGDDAYCVLGNVGNSMFQVFGSMLTKVEIGKNVPQIIKYAFQKCVSLSSIVIPNSITSIGDKAFSGCSGLSSIVIPNGVTSIGSSVFNECYSLSSIVIPNSITSIGEKAFYKCVSLSSIVIPNSITSISGYVFQDCSGLSSIVIPNSITSIGSYAFQNCISLASVVIPNSVTRIGSYAFGNCSGLGFIDLSQQEIVPSAGSNVISGVVSSFRFIVPDALYDTWIAATNWSTYASKIIKKSDWDASQS